MSTEFKELVDHLKALGYLVYAPANPTTYVYFAEQDGVRFGYAQFSRMRGFQYATVHRQTLTNGTGFQASNPVEALMGIPPGFTGVGEVQKFRNFETFRKQHWQPLEQL